MYPQPELIRLGAHKAALRRTIALRRARCVSAGAGIARPLAWLDRAVALWRRITPVAKLAAIPLVVAAGRTVLPRLKFLGTLLRWAPVVIGAVRGLGQKEASFQHRPPAPGARVRPHTGQTESGLS